ncbi:hypothetical protein D1007_18256 [Hordeum vulgare]|nr:hypothetical protein D1007_18256 [Hordeum vulgare]
MDKMLCKLRRKLAVMSVKPIDIKKLKLSNLEINSNNYINIQVEWRDPYNKKEFDSSDEVAGRVIDDNYKDMKNGINRKEDHILWGFYPLPEKLIKYAAIDAYASYESWKHIEDIAAGLHRVKEEKEPRKKSKDVIPYNN